MINLYPNLNHSRKNQDGVGTLIITVILLAAAVLVIVYSSNFSLLQQKTGGNQVRNNQAYSAAEAGLDYGIVYLFQNLSTVIANPVNGFVNYGASDSNITNVTLANGSKYSITYTNPNANDFTLMRVTSTGTNSDGTATRVMQQSVLQQSIIIPGSITLPTTAKGDVSLKGNDSITNTTGNLTVRAGGSAKLQGSATTTGTPGSSKAGSIGSDIQQNANPLHDMANSAIFASYFGTDMNTIKARATNVFTSTKPNIDGMTGTSIFIDNDYKHSGNDTIGSINEPVILIVNGNLDNNGTITIYGFVYVDGDADLGGNVTVIGGIVATGNLNMNGNVSIAYDTTVITNLSNTSPSTFVKVPGSWRDFQ